MTHLRRQPWPVALALAFGLAACGDDDAGSGPAGGGDGADDAGAPMACSGASDELTFGPSGLLAHGDGLVTARVLHASHVPPYFGFNAWTIGLEHTGAGGDIDGGAGEAGTAATDYQITWMCSFMKAHGHGAQVRIDDASGKDGDGKFEVERINLQMTGDWQVRLWVDPIGAGKPPYTAQKDPDPLATWCSVRDDLGRPFDLEFRVCVPKK